MYHLFTSSGVDGVSRWVKSSPVPQVAGGGTEGQAAGLTLPSPFSELLEETCSHSPYLRILIYSCLCVLVAFFVVKILNLWVESINLIPLLTDSLFWAGDTCTVNFIDVDWSLRPTLLNDTMPSKHNASDFVLDGLVLLASLIPYLLQST